MFYILVSVCGEANLVPNVRIHTKYIDEMKYYAVVIITDFFIELAVGQFCKKLVPNGKMSSC